MQRLNRLSVSSASAIAATPGNDNEAAAHESPFSRHVLNQTLKLFRRDHAQYSAGSIP
jgi:hypothetical protein